MKELLASYILHLASRVPHLTEKRFLVILITSDLALKTFRLWDPSKTYFDEGPFYIKAARDLLQGIATTNFEHPPLAKIILAASIAIFGDNPFGWRLPSVLLGTIGVVFTYLLAKKLTGSKRIAALAAVLLSFEFGWFVSSRIATLEIFLASFLLIGAYFAVSFWKKQSLVNLGLMGVFFGAALATKWSAVLLISWVFLFLLIFQKNNLVKKLTSLLVASLIILAIYLASYFFYFQGHSFSQFVDLHKSMYSYHTQTVPSVQKRVQEKSSPTDFYLFEPWTWVLDPMFPYYGEIKADKTKMVLLFFNPIIFWGGLVGLLVLIREQFKKVSPEKIFLVGAFLSQWLVWFFVGRYSLPYYLLAGIPFLVISFTLILQRVYGKSRSWFYVLVLGSIAAFAIFYPVLSGLSIPSLYAQLLTTFREFKGN